MAKDASGVIFVSDATQSNITDLESWFVLLAIITIGWWHGITVNNVGRCKEVNQRQTQLVLGWVTIFRWVNLLAR